MANLNEHQQRTYISYLRAYIGVFFPCSLDLEEIPTDLDEANAAAIGASDARRGGLPRWASHVLNAIRVMQDPANTGGVTVAGSIDGTIGGPTADDAPYGFDGLPPAGSS